MIIMMMIPITHSAAAELVFYVCARAIIGSIRVCVNYCWAMNKRRSLGYRLIQIVSWLSVVRSSLGGREKCTIVAQTLAYSSN